SIAFLFPRPIWCADIPADWQSSEKRTPLHISISHFITIIGIYLILRTLFSASILSICLWRYSRFKVPFIALGGGELLAYSLGRCIIVLIFSNRSSFSYSILDSRSVPIFSSVL